LALGISQKYYREQWPLVIFTAQHLDNTAPAACGRPLSRQLMYRFVVASAYDASKYRCNAASKSSRPGPGSSSGAPQPYPTWSTRCADRCRE